MFVHAARIVVVFAFFIRDDWAVLGLDFGTYIGNNLFVHAANRAEGVKISTLEEPKYKRRYKGAGRKR